VLAAFAVCFGSLLTVLEVLLDTSNRHQGLASADTQAYYYLWKYSPTAIFAILAAFWARVAVQTKMVAPWLRMAQNNGRPSSGEKTVLLDYFDMWIPNVLFTAVRNDDSLVLLAVVTELALIAATALSASLISSASVNVFQPASLMLHSQFGTNISRDLYPTLTTSATTLALLTMMGLVDGTLPFPDGTSAQFAHQRFTYDSGAGPEEEIHAVMDGVSVDAHCQSASLDVWNLTYGGVFGGTFDIGISTEDCQLKYTGTMPNVSNYRVNMVSRYWAWYCGGDTTHRLENYRVGMAVLELDKDRFPTHPDEGAADGPLIHPSLIRSAAVICTPTYSLVTLDTVSRGGTVKNVTLRDSSPRRRLENAKIADVMSYYGLACDGLAVLPGDFPKSCGDFGYLPEYCDNSYSVDMNSCVLVALRSYGGTRVPGPTSLLDSRLLGNIAIPFIRQFAIQVVNEAITQPIREIITGISSTLVNRLVFRPLATHLMVASLGLAMTLAIIMANVSPKTGVLPRAPNTIAGIAANLAYSQRVLQPLSGAGTAAPSALRKRMAHIKYRLQMENLAPSRNGPWTWTLLSSTRSPTGFMPTSLPARTSSKPSPPVAANALTRLAVILGVLALIVVLETLLRKSQAGDGVAEIVEGETIFNYLWSISPTILSLLLSSYQAEVDFIVRSREHLNAMCSSPSLGTRHISSISLNLIDRSIPGILVTGIRTRRFSAIFTTASLLASLLSVFSASIFTTKSTRLSSGNQLRPLDSFAPYLSPMHNMNDWSALVTQLILAKNMSYPAFTYGDLVLPRLEMEHPFAGNGTWVTNSSSSEFKIAARMPALRSRLQCHFYSPPSVNIQTISGTGRPLRDGSIDESSPLHNTTLVIGAESQECTVPLGHVDHRWNRDSRDLTIGIAAIKEEDANFRHANFSLPEESAYLERPSMHGCSSDYIYIWGIFSPSSQQRTSLAAYGCNESIEAVEVAVQLLGPDLRIDPSSPPLVVENIATSETVMRPNRTLHHEHMRIESLYMEHLPGTLPMRWLYEERYMYFEKFFTFLTYPDSRTNLSLSDITDPSQEAKDRVAAAIHRQHGIIRAQSLSADYRRPFETDGTVKLNLNSPGLVYNGTNPATTIPLINCTVTDPQGRTRLIQDAASTRFLEGLLAAILVLSVAGWALLSWGYAGQGDEAKEDRRARDMAVWGRSPTCLASVMALLADSNIFEVLLPELQHGTGLTGEESDERVFGGCRFKLGWVEVHDRDAREAWGRDSFEMDDPESGSGVGEGGAAAAAAGGVAAVVVQGASGEKEAGTGGRVFTLVVTRVGDGGQGKSGNGTSGSEASLV
jgi:hypothetical protein